MRIHYTLNPDFILDQEKFEEFEPLFKKAGVTDLWVMGYLFGKYYATQEEYKQARLFLENKGYETGILSVPVGHPGNSINPEEEIDLRIPTHWRYRMDTFGNPRYFASDIEPNMIKDNITAVKFFIEAGYKRIFFDDDLRMGDWGPEVKGCFCDKCLQDFNNEFNTNPEQITRNDLKIAIEKHSNQKLIENWVKFNCDKLDGFFKSMQNGLIELDAEKEVQLGIMIMHYGDERHGISIKNLLELNPDLMIRLGEAHFSDGHFGTPIGKADEITGMQLHLNQLDKKTVCSETTIFPPRALSPENWVLKAKLETILGIDNLFLMGGTWLIEKQYWNQLGDSIEEIKKLSKISQKEGIYYPIHLAIGDYKTSFLAPNRLLLSGIPINPIKSTQFTDMEINDEILIISEDIILSQELLEKFSEYRQILISKSKYQENLKFWQDIPNEKLCIFPRLKITQGLKNNTRSILAILKGIENTSIIRKFLGKIQDIPFIFKGRNMMLFPLNNSKSGFLINLDNKKKNSVVKFNGKERRFNLNPFEIKYISIYRPQ